MVGPPRPESFVQQAHKQVLAVTFVQHDRDTKFRHEFGLQQRSDLRQQQAMSLTYFDVFWLCAVVSLALVVLVLFMKYSVAENCERISAE